MPDKEGRGKWKGLILEFRGQDNDVHGCRKGDGEREDFLEERGIGSHRLLFLCFFLLGVVVIMVLAVDNTVNVDTSS